MTIPISSLDTLSDRDLLAHVQRAADGERQATAQLIALLMELDARRLYLAQGCASLFAYCTQVLHLSEHAAYLRIETARAARRFPVILERLTEGSLHLTAIALLGPHLTPTNHRDVLDAARHKSKRDLEYLVARLAPRPDAPAVVRKLPAPKRPPVAQQLSVTADHGEAAPAPSAASIPPTPLRPAEVKPLAPERYKVQFTVSRETHDKLRRAQDLLRHTIPNGDPAAIFDKALTLLLEELERTKLAAAARPRPLRAARGRHIPAAVKRAVWQRDGGRCAFVGTQGRRCTETGFLEFHHVVPFAAGGETTTANLEVRCGRHNRYEAERFFGVRQPPLVRDGRSAFGAEDGTRSGPRTRKNRVYGAVPRV